LRLRVVLSLAELGLELWWRGIGGGVGVALVMMMVIVVVFAW